LGSDSIAPKYEEGVSGDRTEVLCDEIFPINLKYFSSHSMLIVGIDYETRVEKLNKNDQVYLGYEKPAEHERKRKKNAKKLEVRKRKVDEKEENVGVDHENILEIINDEWFHDSKFNQSQTNIHPKKRIKNKSMNIKHYFNIW
jgi:hypothetical protein